MDRPRHHGDNSSMPISKINNREDTTMTTPIERARALQTRIKATAAAITTAISGLDATNTARASTVLSRAREVEPKRVNESGGRSS
jgi:hypothetical protein